LRIHRPCHAVDFLRPNVADRLAAGRHRVAELAEGADQAGALEYQRRHQGDRATRRGRELLKSEDRGVRATRIGLMLIGRGAPRLKVTAVAPDDDPVAAGARVLLEIEQELPRCAEVSTERVSVTVLGFRAELIENFAAIRIGLERAVARAALIDERLG